MAFWVRARLPAGSMIESATGDFGRARPCARAPKAARPAAPAALPTKVRRVILSFVILPSRGSGHGVVQVTVSVSIGPFGEPLGHESGTIGQAARRRRPDSL